MDLVVYGEKSVERTTLCEKYLTVSDSMTKSGRKKKNISKESKRK